MAFPGYHNSLLITQFREFYEELARLKAIAVNPVAAMARAGSDEPHEPLVEVHDLWQKLLILLEAQAERASRSGGAFGFEVYREAQYVMAALADEFFLNENWPGRQSWPLLETRLFRSAAAGEVVFKKLDLLLLQRDPVYLDLAAVYFFALSLGFKGKFRGNDPQHQLDRYKHQLFAMIFRRNPELLQSGNHIIPQTYLHTLKEGKALKLPHPRKWLLVFAAIILLWVTVSHALWGHLTGPVEQRLQKVEATAGQTVPSGGNCK
jgi:type VI secretion system protein ImpK